MFGVWCEYILVDAEACFPVPEKMTLEEAACIPVNYITAYMMLFEQANLRKGKSVLVHMAAGRKDFVGGYNPGHNSLEHPDNCVYTLLTHVVYIIHVTNITKFARVAGPLK